MTDCDTHGVAFSGLFSIVLGTVLLWGLPISAIWVPGVLMGVVLIFPGAPDPVLAPAPSRG